MRAADLSSKNLGLITNPIPEAAGHVAAAASVGRGVMDSVVLRADVKRATAIFGALTNVLNVRFEMLDRAMESFLDANGVGPRHYAAAAREPQHDVALQAPPTRSRAMSAAERALGNLGDPTLPQQAAFQGLPRTQRERLSHALKQTVHQPNASATAVLEEIAQELKDRSLAQAGDPNLDKIEPQSVRRSSVDAVATAALVLDVESVIAKARHVRPKRVNGG